jgi:hypothetical protein
MYSGGQEEFLPDIMADWLMTDFLACNFLGEEAAYI